MTYFAKLPYNYNTPKFISNKDGWNKFETFKRI